MNAIKCSDAVVDNYKNVSISEPELKELINNKCCEFLDDKTFITESLKLLGTMFYEFDNFNVNTDYKEIYLRFQKSVDKKYMYYFPNILDYATRLIIHEIYLSYDDTTNIVINFDEINKASSANRKHFNIAKKIAEKIIKIYYFSQCKNKKIIEYIDEYLPDNYIKDSDINKVVWYFIVCIISFNKQVVNYI